MIHRCRIQIKVRTAIVLVAVIALGMARQVERARAQRDTVEAILRIGGSVGYDYEYANGRHLLGRSPWAPAWLRRTLGDDYFQRVEVVRFLGLESGGSAGATDTAASSSDDVLARLPALDPFRKLVIYDLEVSSQGLRHISDLLALEELDLDTSFDVTDSFISSLRNLRNLKKLRIALCSQLTDSALRDLARLPSLETIRVDSDHFTDDGLAYFRGMSHLKVFHIARSRRITDAGLAHLRGMSHLEALGLAGSDQITDLGLGHLSGLTNLEWLSIPQSRITDHGLAQLGRLTNLKMLDLSGSRVTNEGLIRLRTLRKLESIYLTNTAVTPEGANRFRQSAPELKGCKWFVGIPSGCLATPLQ